MIIFSNVPFDAIDIGRSLSVSRTMTPTDIETLTFVSGDIDAAQNAPIVLCKGDIAVTERGAHDEGEIDRPLKGIHRIARHQEQLCEGPEVDLDHVEHQQSKRGPNQCRQRLVRPDQPGGICKAPHERADQGVCPGRMSTDCHGD
jgi:hypothetical protein